MRQMTDWHSLCGLWGQEVWGEEVEIVAIVHSLENGDRGITATGEACGGQGRGFFFLDGEDGCADEITHGVR